MPAEMPEPAGPAPSRDDPTRRGVVRAAAAAGVAMPLLAACGADEAADGGAGPGSASGPATVAAADVPVGGGAILAAAKVVVTQPSEGDFKAFTAVCTHQGCAVAEIASGQITCPCHGSAFSIEDGSVVAGPAPEPLAEKTVEVKGDRLSIS